MYDGSYLLHIVHIDIVIPIIVTIDTALMLGLDHQVPLPEEPPSCVPT